MTFSEEKKGWHSFPWTTFNFWVHDCEGNGCFIREIEPENKIEREQENYLNSA